MSGTLPLYGVYLSWDFILDRRERATKLAQPTAGFLSVL